jgi:hypothetical protein
MLAATWGGECTRPCRGDGQIHDRHRYTADGGHVLLTYTQAAHLQLHMHAATLRAWLQRPRNTH